MQAPANAPETTSVFPSPIFNNIESLKAAVNIKRAMTGLRRTYVKSSDFRRVTYTFTLTKLKHLELLNFIESYHSDEIIWIDHTGARWRGYITRNPITARHNRKDSVEVTLDLEGKLLYAPTNQC